MGKGISKRSRGLIKTLNRESKTLSKRFSLAPKARKSVISTNKKIISDLKSGKTRVNAGGKIVKAKMGM